MRPLAQQQLFSALVCGLAAMLATVGAQAAELMIVQDGQPKATIVIAKAAVGAPTEPTAATCWLVQPTTNKIAAAARDLQVYVEKMTAAKLPILGDDQKPRGAIILVGRSALSKDFDAAIPSGMTPTGDEEGYVIATKENRLLLAGNDAPAYHGSEYAVAEFLRRLGVRWYMPGDFGECVPKRKTIAVKDLNASSRPDFKLRNWWGPQSPDQTLIEYRWKIRNGMNPLLDFITIPRDSSIRSLLPPPADLKNAKYAEIWGKTEDGKPHEGMPNLTSEKAVRYAAEKIKDYFRKNPQIKSYGIGGDDGYPRDFSPETVKRSLGMPDVGGRAGVPADLSASEEWMEWIQAVAKEVYKEFPDHVVTTNGYANRNLPPLGVAADRKIWIMFAAIWSDTMHAYDNPRSWMTRRQAEMIQRWKSMYTNVYMYNYIYWMLAGCGAPIPLAHKHMHDMPLYKKWGVVGFSDEGRTVRGESGVFPTYLRARMMWNAGLDAKAEMEEFFANWYGPAKAPAQAFWEELENAFETTPWLGKEDRILPYVYSQPLIDKLEQRLRDAEKLAADPWSKPRVLADRVTLEHLKAFMAMNRAEFAADFVEAARQAQRMVDVRKNATALSRFYFDPDPKTGESMGYYYWGSVARRDYYQKLADLTTGKSGQMAAVLPEKAKFHTDPRDDGRYFAWYAPEFDDAGWESILTTMPFYRQAKGCVDAEGYPYLGPLWYRLEVQASAPPKGAKVFLYIPAVETEAWLWVNGQFIGHRPYHEAYERPNPLDMDVTRALKPGSNSIVLRVHTSLNASSLAGGIVSRAFLYSPKPK